MRRTTPWLVPVPLLLLVPQASSTITSWITWKSSTRLRCTFPSSLCYILSEKAPSWCPPYIPMLMSVLVLVTVIIYEMFIHFVIAILKQTNHSCPLFCCPRLQFVLSHTHNTPSFVLSPWTEMSGPLPAIHKHGKRGWGFKVRNFFVLVL